MDRNEPFKDIAMAKKWGCLKPDKFMFVPVTHKFAPIILNNWDLDWMGWKYDDKYMLIPISDIHAIETALTDSEEDYGKMLIFK